MNIFQAILLGLLQGVTEFLPISSQGHLILAESLLGLQVEDLVDFDIMVHMGTLLALVVYLWKDLVNPRYWKFLVIGSIPAFFVGIFMEDLLNDLFRSALAVGLCFLLMGVLFVLPEPHHRDTKRLTPWRVFLIGIAQAIAIVPGISRSGSTLFTGSLLGLDRDESARFSFMLGTIAIAGGGFLTFMDLESFSVPFAPLMAGFLASFVAGLFSISWLMKFLRTRSLWPFGVYLLVIGLASTVWALLV